jgi:hypothetical protein
MAAVRAHLEYRRALFTCCFQHSISATSVGDIRRMHHYRHQVAVDSLRRVRSLPLGRLFFVEAPVSPGIGRRHALAVDDPGTRLGLSPDTLSCSTTQCIVDALRDVPLNVQALK